MNSHRLGVITAKPRFTTPNMALFELDDQCLHHLFEYIPLMEQITSLSLVCRPLRASLLKKWSELKQVTVHESVVTISLYRDRYQSNGSLNYFPHEYRYDASRSFFGPYRNVAKFIEFFHLRFPAIIELILFYTGFSSSQISILLSDRLRGQLQLFALFRLHSESIVDLIPVLKQLRSLRHLSLHDVGDSIAKLSQLFTQLETFYLTYFLSDLFSVVNRLSANIRRLVLYAADFAAFSTSELVKIRPEIGQSVTYLALDNCFWDFGPRAPANLEMFNYLMNNFTNLSEIDIPTHDGIKLDHILKSLKNQKNLTYLHLTCYDQNPLQNISTESVASSFQLSSVKRLTIENNLGPCGNTLKRFRLFGLIFPNLDYLTLNCCPIYCRESGHPVECCPACEKEVKAVVFNSLWIKLIELRFIQEKASNQHENSVDQLVHTIYVNPNANILRRPKVARIKPALPISISSKTASSKTLFSKVTKEIDQSTNDLDTKTVEAKKPFTKFTIDDLDDTTLVYLFKFCPLQIRLTKLFLVCKRWRRVLSSRPHCHEQKSLKIFPSFSEFGNYISYHRSLSCLNSFDGLQFKDDVLIAGGKKNTDRKQFIHYLHRRFPRIKELLLFGMQLSEQEVALLFGGRWRYHLEMFALFESPHTEHGRAFQWNRVYPAISLTTNLKHLMLCDIGLHKPVALYSGALPKLETLYLGYHGKDVFELANQMLSSKARRLVLFNRELDRFQPMEDLKVKIRRCIKKRLQYLALEVALFEPYKQTSCLMDENVLLYVGKSFAGVRVLDIATRSGVKFESILDCIRWLPNLHALRFRSEDPDLMSGIVTRYLHTKSTPPPITTLQQLTIQNSLGPTGSFINHFRVLAQILPGLEYLHLINCPVYCRPDGRHSMVPCDQCDLQLMAMLVEDFPRMRFYRYKRFKYLGEEICTDTNPTRTVEVFATEQNEFDFIRNEGQQQYDQVAGV